MGEKRNNLIRTLALAVLFSLVTSLVGAQTPTSYSGKWEFDKAKSKLFKPDVSFDGTVIMKIVQTSTTITFGETYIQPGSPDWSTSTDSYNLDGKEYIKKDDIGTSKKSAKWSQDKKILLITNSDTQTLNGVPSDFLMADSYKLSDDGLTLTIERYRKNKVTGETTSKLVYHKK